MAQKTQKASYTARKEKDGRTTALIDSGSLRRSEGHPTASGEPSDLFLDEIPLSKEEEEQMRWFRIWKMEKTRLIYLLEDLRSFLGFCGDPESREQEHALDICLDLVRRFYKDPGSEKPQDGQNDAKKKTVE